ncbi:MAG: hypothetical protein SH868_02790 [Bythopirellula sp.]|nr:hypothetical protein [Bythopirellula sp.]
MADCETASVVLDSDQMLPELILLAQPLPGTYQQDEVEQLRRAVPLAQIVVVAGTWCEGELRTGKPLVGVSRLYWYELVPWWHATLKNCTTWPPCLDGPLITRSADALFEHELGGVAVIHAPMYASYETLAEILKPHGMECVWARHESELPPQIAVGIWDGAQLDPPEFTRLQSFASTIRERQGALVVLLDFPRKEHFSRLQKIGCTAILGKPYVLNELVNTLLQITKPGDGVPRV